MEITLLIMEKSWNCVFEFLWEACHWWSLKPYKYFIVLPVFTKMKCVCLQEDEKMDSSRQNGDAFGFRDDKNTLGGKLSHQTYILLTKPSYSCQNRT